MPLVRGQRKLSRQRSGYATLVEELRRAADGAVTRVVDEASSPLSRLLAAIEESWRHLVNGGTPGQFARWLEQTSVTTESANVSRAVEYLDTLDAFLLATIQELEQLRGEEILPADMEEQLAGIWRRSYAFAATQAEERLRRIWLGRGRAIKTRYPDPTARRQIYRTSLAPRSALTLIARVDGIRDRMVAGANYAALGAEGRLAFVGDVLERVSEVPSFRISTKLGRRRREFREWRQVLRWWLAKDTLEGQPKPAEVADWYNFAAQNFIYRGAWGLGSVLSLLLDVAEDGQPIAAIEIDDWPQSGLPWIAFWLKELLIWGTLEPVAAFVLARGNAVDRPGAQREAAAYYEQLPGELDDNERLNPRRIRDWLNLRGGGVQMPRRPTGLVLDVTLSRDAAAYVKRRLHVMHLEAGGRLSWIDAAGYLVATSEKPGEWPNAPERYLFQLDVERSRISGAPYLQHV